MNERIQNSRLALLLAGAVLSSASALGNMTTSQLRDACLTSLNNTVVFTQTAKIIDGARPPLTELVGCPCTIVLQPGAALEFEQVSMTFAGALTIRSPQKAEVKVTRSALVAPSITVNLGGVGSVLSSTLSHLRASAGNLNITVGQEGTVEILERLLTVSPEGLSATGSIRIQGARKLSGLIADTFVAAPAGFRVTMTGTEGLLAIDQATIDASRGSIAITGTGEKSAVSVHLSDLRFRQAASVRLTGRESSIGLTKVTAGGVNGRVAPGGLILEAGGLANDGRIEVAEAVVQHVAGMALLASLHGQKGVLKLEKSSITATGDIVAESGSQGITDVLDNTLTSATRVRVAAGLGGSCKVDGGSALAPVLQLCP